MDKYYENEIFFFTANGFELPWWIEQQDVTMLPIVCTEDIEEIQEENLVIENNVENEKETKPAKKENFWKKLGNFFKNFFVGIIDVINSPSDSNSIPKSSVLKTTSEEIDEKNYIPKINTLSMSVLPIVSEPKYFDVNAFFLYWRNLAFLRNQINIAFPEYDVNNVHKLAVKLDKETLGSFNSSHPTLKSLMQATLDLKVLNDIDPESTFTDIYGLKREMHRNRIALIQLENKIGVVYGFSEEYVWLYIEGEYQKMQWQQIQDKLIIGEKVK